MEVGVGDGIGHHQIDSATEHDFNVFFQSEVCVDEVRDVPLEVGEQKHITPRVVEAIPGDGPEDANVANGKGACFWSQPESCMIEKPSFAITRRRRLCIRSRIGTAESRKS